MGMLDDIKDTAEVWLDRGWLTQENYTNVQEKIAALVDMGMLSNDNSFEDAYHKDYGWFVLLCAEFDDDYEDE